MRRQERSSPAFPLAICLNRTLGKFISGRYSFQRFSGVHHNVGVVGDTRIVPAYELLIGQLANKSEGFDLARRKNQAKRPKAKCSFQSVRFCGSSKRSLNQERVPETIFFCANSLGKGRLGRMLKSGMSGRDRFNSCIASSRAFAICGSLPSRKSCGAMSTS